MLVGTAPVPYLVRVPDRQRSEQVMYKTFWQLADNSADHKQSDTQIANCKLQILNYLDFFGILTYYNR